MCLFYNDSLFYFLNRFSKCFICIVYIFRCFHYLSKLFSVFSSPFPLPQIFYSFISQHPIPDFQLKILFSNPLIKFSLLFKHPQFKDSII